MEYPILCSFLGRHDEALLHAGKAVELEPLDLMTNWLMIGPEGQNRQDRVKWQKWAIGVE
jgi:hypothetical protein